MINLLKDFQLWLFCGNNGRLVASSLKSLVLVKKLNYAIDDEMITASTYEITVDNADYEDFAKHVNLQALKNDEYSAINCGSILRPGEDAKLIIQIVNADDYPDQAFKFKLEKEII